MQRESLNNCPCAKACFLQPVSTSPWNATGRIPSFPLLRTLRYVNANRYLMSPLPVPIVHALLREWFERHTSQNLFRLVIESAFIQRKEKLPSSRRLFVGTQRIAIAYYCAAMQSWHDCDSSNICSFPFSAPKVSNFPGNIYIWRYSHVNVWKAHVSTTYRERAREELESGSLHDKTCTRVSFQHGDHRVLSFERHPVHTVGNQQTLQICRRAQNHPQMSWS